VRRALKLAELTRPAFSLLREQNVRKGFFERNQFDSVVAHLPDALRPVVAFAYITGWRINSEVLPLDLRQVDFAAGEVRLDPGTTKNDEGRTFPFTHDLRTLLQHQKATVDALKAKGMICPYVFHRDGKPIKNFRHAWITACRNAGVPGRFVHDFRRTAVRNLVRAGVPQSVAKKMTSHKTDSVFQRYDIVSPDDLRVAAARLNNLPALYQRARDSSETVGA
jgi:integrase